MKSLMFSSFAAGCAASANLFFRKNVSSSTETYSPSGYLLLFYLFSFISSLIFYPDIWTTHLNIMVVIIGISVGILNVALMFLTSQALKKGPAGMTFAFQNASAVFPGLLLFVVFGTEFGYSYSFPKLLGMLLVISGLIVGAKNQSSGITKASFKWLVYAIACFSVQVFALTLIQGRCVLFKCEHAEGLLSMLAVKEIEDAWFMPWQFGAAFFLQLIVFLYEKRPIRNYEAYFGLLAGVANFASTGLLLLATKSALPFEQALILPIFAVFTIILCGLWAKWLYGERFNLFSILLCGAGICIAMLK